MNEWHSQDISELCAALSAAQGAMGSATRNAKAGGEKFSYKYATLEDCWEIARPALAANGLALTQWPLTTEQGLFALRSMLTHKSGQWIASEWAILVTNEGRMNPHQEEGSALTYARKYSLCAIAGIPQEDDDGAGASAPGQTRASPAASAAPPGTVPIGKHKGKAWADVEGDYLKWAVTTDNPVMRDGAKAELARRNGAVKSDEPPPYTDEDAAFMNRA